VVTTPVPSAPAVATARPEVVVDRVLPVIAEARKALQEGDLDRALDRLSAAAVFDPGHSAVHEVAEALVSELRVAARGAVAGERWEEAEQRLTTAIDLAHRFALDSREVEDELDELRRRDWVARVKPTDWNLLHQLVGREVVVELDNGHEMPGRIEALDAVKLTLRVEQEVGGGDVTFTNQIALAKVREVRHLIEH
jgi:hypothetical protein